MPAVVVCDSTFGGDYVSPSYPGQCRNGKTHTVSHPNAPFGHVPGVRAHPPPRCDHLPVHSPFTVRHTGTAAFSVSFSQPYTLTGGSILLGV